MFYEIFRKFCLVFLTEFCFDEFFVEYNFLHAQCLKASISKALGFSLIAGSLLVKVPQLLKLYNAKSGEGISIFGTSLELLAMVVHFSYSFVNQYPFSSYGDSFFLLVQTAIIAALVLHYGGSVSSALLYLLGTTSLVGILAGGFAPYTFLWMLETSNIGIVFMGKMVQFITNYKSKSTGQLSFVTVTLLVLGSIARIFTSIQETGDLVIILTYLVGSLSNGAIFFQILYYWDKKVDAKKKKQ